MGVDVRSRVDDDVTAIDAEGFVRDVAPGLTATNGRLAADGMTQLGLRPLAIDVEGTSFSFRSDDGELVVESGVVDDAFVLELSEDQFADYVQDLVTATTFLTAASATVRHGSIFHVIAWEPVLRAFLDGRPVHTPGAVDFRARDGGPLDLDRSFSPEDDDAEIAHFLTEAGFLHLRGWLDPDDMAIIAADMDRALPTYRPDDGRSWWARTADGAHQCVRMQHFVDHSPTVAATVGHPALQRLAALTGDGHRVGAPTGNVVEALVKPIGVVEGISDVPWHKDCSLGRHSYRCCALTVGISVTGSDATSGQLRVIAGSHRANLPPFSDGDTDLPDLGLPTEPGDLTVHLSCTLHMATPPTERERKVLYTNLALPERGGPERTRTDLSAVRENAYKTVSQPPAGSQS